jgi:hypothetical protein
MKQSFWFFGAHVSILADEHATHGLYDIIEGDFTPGSATPWHVHQADAEEICVAIGFWQDIMSYKVDKVLLDNYLSLLSSTFEGYLLSFIICLCFLHSLRNHPLICRWPVLTPY